MSCPKIHLRTPEAHPAARNRIQHPGRHRDDFPWTYLDMNDLARRTPLTVLAANRTPVEWMPAIVDYDALPDMGRMTARLPWVERIGCFVGPRSAPNTSASSRACSEPAACNASTPTPTWSTCCNESRPTRLVTSTSSRRDSGSNTSPRTRYDLTSTGGANRLRHFTAYVSHTCGEDVATTVVAGTWRKCLSELAVARSALRAGTAESRTRRKPS